jgi:hypothetical protein
MVRPGRPAPARATGTVGQEAASLSVLRVTAIEPDGGSMSLRRSLKISPSRIPAKAASTMNRREPFPEWHNSRLRLPPPVPHSSGEQAKACYSEIPETAG